jgi:hypothetical protein
MLNVAYNLMDNHNEKHFYKLQYDSGKNELRTYGKRLSDHPIRFKIDHDTGRVIKSIDLRDRDAKLDKVLEVARQKAALAKTAISTAAIPAISAISAIPAKSAKPVISAKSAKSATPVISATPPKSATPAISAVPEPKPDVKITPIPEPDKQYYENLFTHYKEGHGITKTPLTLSGGSKNPATGINNISQTCWFNSFLQLLWKFSDFRRFIIDTMDYDFINNLRIFSDNNLNIDYDMTHRELYLINKGVNCEHLMNQNGIDGFANFLRALHILFKVMNRAEDDKNNNYTIDIKKLIVPVINKPVITCYSFILNKVIFESGYLTSEEKKTPPNPVTGYDKQADAEDAFIYLIKYLKCVINESILELFKKFFIITRSITKCKDDENNYSLGGADLGHNIFLNIQDNDTTKGISTLQGLINKETLGFNVENFKLCNSYVKDLSDNMNATASQQYIPFEISKYIYVALQRGEQNWAAGGKHGPQKKSKKIIDPFGVLTINNIKYKLKGLVEHTSIGDGVKSGHYTFYEYQDGVIIYQVSDSLVMNGSTISQDEKNTSVTQNANAFLYEIDDTQALDHTNFLKRIPFSLYEPDSDYMRNNRINITEWIKENSRESYLQMFTTAGIRSVGFKTTLKKLDKRKFGQFMPNKPTHVEYGDVTNKETIKQITLNIRANVAIDTIEILEKDSENGYLHFQAYNNVAGWNKNPTNKEPEKISFKTLDSGLRILSDDWGVVTLKLTKEFGKIFSCLNMANAGSPGSSYLEGRAAQEENMFRRTDCHYSINERHIKKKEDYDPIKHPKYDANTRRYNDKMFNLISGQPSTYPYDNCERFVYMDIDYPRICIKGDEIFENDKIDVDKSYKLLNYDDIFVFYELRAAAKNYSHQHHGGTYPEELKDIIELRLRIRAQINTLKAVNQKYAVLSAFGAGAFSNDCSNVAMIYYDELLEEKDFFKVIAFAIKYSGNGPGNFEIFKAVFSTWPNPRQVAATNPVNQTVTPPAALLNSEDYGRPKPKIPRRALTADDIKRQIIMDNTLEELNKRRIDFYTAAANNLVEFKKLSQAVNPKECMVTVVPQDSLTATKIATTTYGMLFACLNFADSKNPGGGYRNGRHPQEEDIFLRTDCHFSLGIRGQSDILYPDPDKSNKVNDDYIYDEKKTALIQGITGRVYLIDTPQICFRNNKDTNYAIYPDGEIFPFYELRAAALNFNTSIHSSVHFSNTCIETIAQTELRIAAQLDTLIERGIRYVILGAFGCGAFKNDPNIVANAYYKEITKRRTHFDVIQFAMAETVGNNSDVIHSVFDKWNPIKPN